MDLKRIKLRFRHLTTTPTMRVPEQERITRTGLHQKKEKITMKRLKQEKTNKLEKDITLEKCIENSQGRGLRMLHQ